MDCTLDYSLISEWWIGEDLEGGGISLTEAQSWLLLGETEENHIKQQDNKCSGKILYQVPPAHNSRVMLLEITCLVNQ